MPQSIQSMIKKGTVQAGVTLILSAAWLTLALAEPQITDIKHKAEDVVDELLAPADIRHETGFGYIAQLTKGRSGDKDNPKSNCILLENGKPLSSPSALHKAIREEGRGRYSHWSEATLYFSASDNTDPGSNGREYRLTSGEQVIRHRTTVQVTEADNHYEIVGNKESRLSNQRLTIRNLGTEATVIPRLRLKGWPDLSSSEALIGSIVKPSMNDEEKTLAIWKFLVDWRYHFYPAEDGSEVHDPIKFINVYGYGFCDDSARNAAVLAHLAGLRSRVWGLNGHVVAETFYDDRWHMIDPDHEAFYRTAKGHIASVEELAAQPEIILKTKRDPIGSDSGAIAKLYTSTHDNAVAVEKYDTANHRLDPHLRPGDELIFDLRDQTGFHGISFAHEGKPPVFANGKFNQKIESSPEPFHVRSPYVIIGGELISKSNSASVSISADGENFEKLAHKTRSGVNSFSLDDWVKARELAVYDYWLKFDGAEEESGTKVIQLSTRFQFAPRAIAQVQSEKTAFEVSVETTDGSPLPKDWEGLEIIHDWQETIDP